MAQLVGSTDTPERTAETLLLAGPRWPTQKPSGLRVTVVAPVAISMRTDWLPKSASVNSVSPTKPLMGISAMTVGPSGDRDAVCA